MIRALGLAGLVVVWVGAALSVRAGTPTCEPSFTFDQSGEGWYYLQADGDKNYDVWRPTAGVGGSGALVLPPGVDVIYLDSPLDLPSRDLCFIAGVTAGDAPEVATVWWLQHDHASACLEEGCYITHFPPRSSVVEVAAGFSLFYFPQAMIQGPQCDQPETSAIAVVHNLAFAIDDLGTLAGVSDLSITKVPDGDFVFFRTGRYVLTVTNVATGPGSTAREEIRVTDILPAYMRPIPRSGIFTLNGWSCSVDGQLIECLYTGSPLASGASAPPISLEFDLIPEPETLFVPNCARVEMFGDVDPANNEACHEHVVSGQLDLALSKQCELIDNDLVQCTLTVMNVGSGPVEVFEVIDNLPDGLLFDSADGFPWNCSYEPPLNSLSCSYIGLPLAPGTKAELGVVLSTRIQPKPQNCARVEAAGDSIPENDRSCDPASASPVNVFTDRDSWEAAVGDVVCEEFEEELLTPNRVVPTPFRTAGGTLLVSLGSPDEVDIQYLNPGLVNGSGEFHFRDFSRGVRASRSAEFAAFGFEYDTAIESWVLEALGVSTTLASETSGFVGYILNQPESSFQLTGDAGAQGGISLDNLCRPGSTSVCGGAFGGIFCDGFESGTTSAWSSTVDSRR